MVFEKNVSKLITKTPYPLFLALIANFDRLTTSLLGLLNIHRSEAIGSGRLDRGTGIIS